MVFASERGSASGALWTIHPDGTHLKKLYQDRNGRFPITPTWSPDGRYLLFALDPTNDAFMHLPNKVYVIKAEGTGLTQVGHLVEGFKRWFEWTRLPRADRNELIIAVTAPGPHQHEAGPVP